MALIPLATLAATPFTDLTGGPHDANIAAIFNAGITKGCDPSYPTICLPPAPPDLDCRDIPYKNFPVKKPDPHRLDNDNDGIGCAS